jgi:hypothetical protein
VASAAWAADGLAGLGGAAWACGACAALACLAWLWAWLRLRRRDRALKAPGGKALALLAKLKEAMDELGRGRRPVPEGAGA